MESLFVMFGKAFLFAITISAILTVLISIFFWLFIRPKEKIEKKFRDGLKMGDSVSYGYREVTLDGIVIDKDPLGDGKFVTIRVLVPKDRIYSPLNKNK